MASGIDIYSQLLISVMQRRSNCDSWYKQCQLLMSRILILDIKNLHSWYQELEFLIPTMGITWYQKCQLLISANEFLISTMYSWYQYLNSWYQQLIADIKNSNCWYQQMNSWFQELELLISVIPIVDIRNTNCWYHEMCTHTWYHEIDLLISGIRILVISNWITDISNAVSL